MPSLTDLFNPTFLMFLGILVLVVALLVVYFETKFREQNHKISSMLSLVSSLAEEVNGSKMIIHQLTMNHQPHSQQFFQQQQQPNFKIRIIEKEERQSWVLDIENKRRAPLDLEVFNSYEALEDYNDAKETESNEKDFEIDFDTDASLFRFSLLLI